MKIAICDDNPAFRRQIYTTMKETGILDIKEDTVTEYESCSDYLDKNDSPDLLLLDIEMPGLSGIEMLKKFPERFKKTKVALLTFHENYALEGYEAGVYRYLKKPVQENKLRELLAAIRQENILKNKITIYSSGIECKLALENIIYIASFNNHCEIITPNKKFIVYRSLKELETLLPEKYFTRPHKSFIINWIYVKDFNQKEKELIMMNNDKINVAAKKLKLIQETYINMRL